jgi:hypothetical protein
MSNATDNTLTNNAFIEYQRYLLLLREFEREENREYFEKFVQALLAKNGHYDDYDASPESLAKIDIALASHHTDLIKKVAPQVYEAVQARIETYDATNALEKAGYDIFESGQSLVTMGFASDIQVLMAFEDAFPDHKGVPLLERLKNAKDNVLAASKSDTGKLALSSITFAIAVGIGSGVALPITTALFAAKLMENKHVQNTMTAMDDKLTSALVKLGFKKESVEARKIPLGEKMKAISESSWFKKAKIPLVACSILVGVGAITIATTGANLSEIPEILANLNPVPAIDKGVDLISQAHIIDRTAEIASSVGDSAINFANGTMNFAGATADFITQDHLIDRSIELASNIGDTTVKATNHAFNAISHGHLPSFSVDPSIDVPQSDAPMAHAPGIQHTQAPIESIKDFAMIDPFENILGQSSFGSPSETFHVIDPSTAHQATEALTSTHIVKPGDNLWNIAKDHYKTVIGSDASPQQIVAMINDLGISDPNHINIGQSITFPDDLQKYSDVKNVTASWLQEDIHSHINHTGDYHGHTNAPATANTHETLKSVHISDSAKHNMDALEALKNRFDQPNLDRGLEI